MARLNRSWSYGALLLPVLLGGCTGPMLALDCISTSISGHGPNYSELDITLKVRDKNGQVSEQKKHKLCQYDGVTCSGSGAQHQWKTPSETRSMEISTPNGQKLFYSPHCGELTPGSLRFTDAFFVERNPGQAWGYANPSLTGSDALAAYGIQVIGIKISARRYDFQEWKPILSWGYY